jgi:hypothetical protein
VRAECDAVTTTPTRCRIVYDEDWRPDLASAMQSDPSADAMQRGFEELAEVLAGLVDRAEEVTLVVPVGLAAAVMRRESNAGYHTDRGTGLVAARTMKRPDGRFDVIIETGLLGDVDAAGQSRWTAAGLPRLSRTALEMLRRSIFHEAQHVVMAQRNSGSEEYALETHAGNFPRWDYAVSAKMCDEHRAEWNAIRLTSRTPPTPDAIVAVLAHLGAELAAADARYQSSSTTPDDTYQLLEDVYNACAPFWTSMAYWSAQLRTDDQVFDFGSETTDLELWRRYVGPTWRSLGRVIVDLPVADLMTSAATLQKSARDVANWVAESLSFISFTHILGADGEAFYIERHDFPS